MDAKILYRLYSYVSNTIILCDTDYSTFSEDWVKLGEISVAYQDELQVQDVIHLELMLKEKREKLLAKAQLVNERIANMQCIEYVPDKNAYVEGDEHDTGATH